MIVYESTKQEFLKDVFEDQLQLVTNIGNNNSEKIDRINEEKYELGITSMQYMYRVLSGAETSTNAGVAIEFKIPHTS